jgi:hypothetical protein
MPSLSVSVPSKRNNNIVAESDVQAAMQAVQESLTAIKNSFSNTATEPTQLELLLDACSESLVAHIERAVQPLADEAFHVYKQQLQSVQNTNEVDVDASLEPNNAIDKDDETSDDDESHNFDDDELLNHETLARVQKVRAQVREQAVHVAACRAQVLQRALALGQASCAQQQQQQTTTSASRNANDTPPTTTAAAAAMEAMQASLQQVTHALQQELQVSTGALSNLQETVRAVRGDLDYEANAIVDLQQHLVPPPKQNNNQDDDAMGHLARIL